MLLLAVTPFEFPKIFSIKKQKSPAYCVTCLHDPTFSHFNRTPTRDRQTDTGRQHIPHQHSLT